MFLDNNNKNNGTKVTDRIDIKIDVSDSKSMSNCYSSSLK